MQQPQVFRQISRSYEGLARDIMIWASYDNSEWRCILPVGKFCKVFGYNRQHLLKKLTSKQLKQLDQLHGVTDVTNVIEYVLYFLQKTNLTFEEKYSHVNAAGCIEKVTKFNTIPAVIGNLTFTRSPRGFMYSFQVQDYYRRACQQRYQTFLLEYYLNVRTEEGYAWNHGRSLFLRMMWKRYNFESSKSSYKDGEDNYKALCKAAGISHDCEKRNAYELRGMLHQVNKLGNIGMEATVENRVQLGQVPYRVIFEKVKQVDRQLKLKLQE